MGRGKGGFYLALAALLILAAILLPFAINLASDTMVKKILGHRETETSTESETSPDETEETEMKSEKEKTVLTAAEVHAGTGSTSPGRKQAEEETKQSEQKTSEAIPSEKAKEQEKYRKDLQNYVTEFQPGAILYLNMAKEDRDYLKNLEPIFLKALAEHLYSLYGDQIRVSQVVIQGVLGSDPDEYIFYLTVETDDGESEGFYCSYDRELEYCKLYSMYMG